MLLHSARYPACCPRCRGHGERGLRHPALHPPPARRPPAASSVSKTPAAAPQGRRSAPTCWRTPQLAQGPPTAAVPAGAGGVSPGIILPTPPSGRPAAAPTQRVTPAPPPHKDPARLRLLESGVHRCLTSKDSKECSLQRLSVESN